MSGNIVVCHYRPKSGAVDELLELIREHRTVYREAELATDRPEYVYVGTEQDGSGPLVIAIFEWINEEAVSRAHQHPKIAVLWERMEALCEARSGRPAAEFPHFREPEVLT
jgi:hypothetical protein